MNRPTVLAYGMGVDSTALLIELVARGEAPDLVLTADTGSDKRESYAYLAMMRQWMADRNIAFELVRYEAKRYKHHPKYRTIVENCLTNATLPSATFGRGTCSIKWKQEPMTRFLTSWQPAIESWARGERVVRMIGYDASPRDTARFQHASSIEDPRFEARYPLREWGWTRDDCTARIADAGLPIPCKSSCICCIAMKVDEVRALPREDLRLIVLMEARAAPRLRTVEGLWRTSTRTKPGRMTDFIAAERLLPQAEIDSIQRNAPLDLVAFQNEAATQPLAERPTMRDWLDRFNARSETCNGNA